MTTFSFEFFPPATIEARQDLLAVAKELATHEPRFMSVTYGAGGSTRERTIDTVRLLRQHLSTPIAAHLTTVAASQAETHELLDTYSELGVRHLVALRGDGAGSEVGNGYRTAADLVAAIRTRSDGAQWDISVAAYPEVHPRARSAKDDLDNLKRKLDAGADQALTQFFFDADLFLRFRQTADDAGITAPIVPGIMTINKFTAVSRFAKRCGAEIPSWMSHIFEGLDDDPEVHQCVAASVAAEQCRQLADEGVSDFHFYTMNRRHLSSATIRTLTSKLASNQTPGQAPDRPRIGAGSQQP